MKKQLVILAIALSALIVTNADAQVTPRKGDPHITFNAGSLMDWQVTNKFWNTHTTKCGDSLYYLLIETKYDNERLLQSKNPTITVDLRPGHPLTEADRLNGVVPIELKGSTTIKFTSNRSKMYKDVGKPSSNATWSNWRNGGEVTVSMLKRAGRWEVSDCYQAASAFCQQVKAIRCADINGPPPDHPRDSSNSPDRPTLPRRDNDIPKPVTSFYIMFEQDDSGNKRRNWLRRGDNWVESYVDGRTPHEFRSLGRIVVDNCPGVIAQKNDGSQVFIPDKGCDNMWLRYRYQTKEWGFMGHMQEIR